MLEVFGNSVVNDCDFFWVCLKMINDVALGMVGNCDDVLGLFDGMVDGEVVGESVVPLGHFFAWKKGKSEVVNSHDERTII